MKLSRHANEDVCEMDVTEIEAVTENLVMEIYDVVWNLLDLADMADMDLEAPPVG